MYLYNPQKSEHLSTNFGKSVISTTLTQTFIAAKINVRFTEILLNHSGHIEELLIKYDIYQNKPFLNEAEMALIFDQELDLFKEKHWLGNQELLQKIVNICGQLAYVERILIGKCIGTADLKENSNEVFNKVVGKIQNRLVIASYLDSDVYKFNGMILQKHVINYLDGLSHDLFFNAQNLTVDQVLLFNDFSQLWLKMTHDFIELENNEKFTGVKKLYLFECKNPKYKDISLNKNTKKVRFSLPNSLFESTTYKYIDNDGGSRNHAIIDVERFPDKKELSKWISYSLNKGCECEFDCCGCINESWYAKLLNDKYLWIEKHSYRNV